MDMTKKFIPVFFVLILMANYFNFVGFFFILRTLPCVQGRKLRKRTKAYFIVMHCLYLGVAITACIPEFWPLCRDDKKYPVVLNFASMLFIANYIFHFVINCNKKKAVQRLTESVAVEQNDDEDEFAENGDKKLDEVKKEDEEAEILRKWQSKSASQNLRKGMFKAQMKAYLCFSTILVTINLTLQIYGRYVSHQHEILGCSANGWQWLYTTIIGEFYITAHIVQIIMQAVMLEKALHTVPHKLGWFEVQSKHSELGSSDEEDNSTGGLNDLPSPSINDDDYKREK